MQGIIDGFANLGIYGYLIVALFVGCFIIAIVSLKKNKAAKDRWLEQHPGAVKLMLKSENKVITSNQISAAVISGEATAFMETSGYVIYAMPGDVVLEVVYTYTRPGVLYKNVTKTWGPSRVEVHLEGGRDYCLSFDKDEERFELSEV